jgi:predicted DNA binding CopG/RHH family protein
MSVIAPVRIDSTVWGGSTMASSLFDSRTGKMSSASMVPGTGEKGERFMKSRIKYTDERMGELKVIRDFLPPPEQLALKENKVKITISLSRSSIDFFKKEAKRNRTSYQKMIRRVIDSYASHYQESV